MRKIILGVFVCVIKVSIFVVSSKISFTVKKQHRMNKAELIDKISKDAGITKVQANEALDSFTNAVVTTLKNTLNKYHFPLSDL